MGAECLYDSNLPASTRPARGTGQPDAPLNQRQGQSARREGEAPSLGSTAAYSYGRQLFNDLLLDNIENVSDAPGTFLQVPYVPSDKAVVEARLERGEGGPRDLGD